MLITVMTGSYCCLWFLPMPDPPDSTEPPLLEYIYKLNDTIHLKAYQNDTFLDKYTCNWNCSVGTKFPVYLSNSTYINTIYVDGAVNNQSCSLYYMDFDDVRQGQVICVPRQDCNLLCYDDSLDGPPVNRSRREISNSTGNRMDLTKDGVKVPKVSELGTGEEKSAEGSFYMTGPFWAFVVLMCLGTVAFNVANCIGDAVCFDVLGKCHYYFLLLYD